MNILSNVQSIARDIGVSGLLDIIVMSLLIYIGIVWFKRTKTAFVLTGIGIVAVVYLLTREFNLSMTAAVFESFFAVILIALVVIFQEDLRHIFEQVAVWSLKRRFLRPRAVRLSRREVEILVRTLTDFARGKIGALVVIQGKDLLDRHLDGGIDLQGVLSEPLLKSLFDPHSMGHDGAVIIQGDHVVKFSAHLPLSKNLEKVGKGGTRHAAALGLSEVTDAFCLVVSEERGTISVARSGDIEVIDDAENLALIIEKFYLEMTPRHEPKPWEGFLRRNWREKIAAFLIAFGLWWVLIHDAKLMYKTYLVSVKVAPLGNSWTVTNIDPPDIEVTLKGPRRAFYFMTTHRMHVNVAVSERKGTQKIRILNANIHYPKSLILENAEPRQVKVEIDEKKDV